MDIKNELIKRLDDHGYKLNDKGDIVVKFSKLIDGELATVEKLILKIGDWCIDVWWEGFDGKRICLMILSFKGFTLCNDEDFRKISDFFDPEDVSKVMELLKLTHDILDEIISNNNIPDRYRTQSGKNFMSILKDEMLTKEEYLGFLKGNVYKYIFRYQKKNGKDDLKKAKHYLELLEAEIDE